jgi:tetratricopeptide (TPR) repeat protein
MTSGVLLVLATLQFAILDRDIKDIAAWVREDTNDAHRQYVLALAHWKRHEWRETDSLLRLAVRMEPRYPEAYLALSYLPYSRRTQLREEERRKRVPEAWRPVVTEAHDFYVRAFRTDPMVSLEILGLAYDVQDWQAVDYDLQDYQTYLRYYAWFADLGQGRYRSAYDRLDKLARKEFGEAKHPDQVPNALLLYRGLAAAHTVRYEAALANFRELLERTRRLQEGYEVIPIPLQDNDYRFMLAAIHHTAGHTDSAVAWYQESLAHDLGLVMAHTYLANLHEKAGRADEALLERRRAVEASGDDPAALFDLAISLFNAGRVGEALDYLYRAIGVNPRYSPPYYLLGRIGEALEQPDDAREQYTRFLSRAPLRLTDLRTDAQQRLDRLSK